MNRILEAFTKAHDQVTAIDQLIMAGVLLPILLVLMIIMYWVASKLDR